MSSQMDKIEDNDIIPFDYWISSQLSIAKYSGGCRINGVDYFLDYDNCRTETDENGETLYFPDLVKKSVLNKRKKKGNE